jgi:hypothetical protein
MIATESTKAGRTVAPLAPAGPRISVIMPVHHGGDAFRASYRSVLDDMGPGDELIVVADGQTDGAWREVPRDRARVILRPTPAGPAAARNRGARDASGDILFFVDADVVVPPGTLSRVRSAMAAPAGAAALIGSYDDQPGCPGFHSQYRNLLHHFTHQQSQPQVETFWGACGAIRREVFLEMGGFDEGFDRPCIEDIELGYRLRAAGHVIAIDKELQVKHLKTWTPRRMLATDVFARAAPWTQLLLARGSMENNLNIDTRGRLSTAAVCLAPLAALGFTGMPVVGAVLALALLAAAAVINASFYRFLADRRGIRFAACAIPWHLTYYACGGVGFALGAIRHLLTPRAAVAPRGSTISPASCLSSQR